MVDAVADGEGQPEVPQQEVCIFGATIAISGVL
jgi:hypothetical protein